MENHPNTCCMGRNKLLNLCRFLIRAAKFCTCCNFCKCEAFIGAPPAPSPYIRPWGRAGLESFIIDKANISFLEIRRYGTYLDGCITLQTRKAQVSGHVWKKRKR